jgi:hypothetical protein
LLWLIVGSICRFLQPVKIFFVKNSEGI